MAMQLPEKIDVGLLMASHLGVKVGEKQLKKGLSEKMTAADKVKFFYASMKENAADTGLFNIAARVPKNNANSKKFREAGNTMFLKGSKFMYEAMQLYNRAICCAEPDNGEELSIAYANRSAVLFEWKEYELCIENIQLAKDTRCPARLFAKLNDRSLQCVTMMKDDPMKGKKEGGGKFFTTRADSWDPKLHAVDPMYNYDKHHSEPILSLMPNSKIPEVVDCLEIKYDSRQGHHIVTKEDLKPGQIVIIENPFAHARLMRDDMYRYTKCANCYEENVLCLIPCLSCTNTMYCSQTCVAEAKQFHDIECPISDFLFKFGWTDLLALRLTAMAYSSFESTEALNDFCQSYKESSAQPSDLSFNGNLSDEQKYCQIYGYTRKKFTEISDYFQAAYFYYILMEKTKLKDFIKSDEDHNVLMTLITRHMEISKRNGIPLTEYRTFDLSDAGDDKSIDIYSQGLYRFTNLIQHSCAPNTAIISKGSKIIVYCNRVIKAGSQVVRSFKGCHYFQHHKSRRQEMLSNMFSITCRCEACVNNYPANYENIKAGKIPSQYDNVTGVLTSMLDYEVKNLDKFLEILEKFDRKLPCLSLNEIQLRVHKAMKLKYGEISSELLMKFKSHPLFSQLSE